MTVVASAGAGRSDAARTEAKVVGSASIRVRPRGPVIALVTGVDEIIELLSVRIDEAAPHKE